MKKTLGLIALAGALALTVTYFRLGAIAKSVIETHGPKMLGVPVEVGAVILSPFSGEARLTSLRVGNPPGFKGDTAFKLDDVRVSLQLKSFRSDGPMKINEILVDGPQVFFEGGPKGSNLSQIQKNLQAYSPARDAGDPKKEAQAERKVWIGLFRLTNGKVTASIPQLPQGKAVDLPPIELKDIGGQNGGVTASEAAKQIIGQVTSSAIKASGGVEALLERGAKALGGDAQKAIDGVRGLLFKKKK